MLEPDGIRSDEKFLVGVSGIPDYCVNLWDWEDERRPADITGDGHRLRDKQRDESLANSPRKKFSPSSEASKRTVWESGNSFENPPPTASSSAERPWISKTSTET